MLGVPNIVVREVEACPKLRLRCCLLTVGSLTQFFACSAALAQTCSLDTLSVNFGTVNVLSGAAVDGVGSVKISCQNGPAPEQSTVNCLSIEGGQYPDGASRRMGKDADRLRFEIFKDAARTQAWGSWETAYGSGIGARADIPYNGTVNYPVYARILPNQQHTPPGNYIDFGFNSVTSRYNYGQAQGCPVTNTTTSKTSTFIQASVAANCLVSASTLNFGVAGQLTTTIDAASTVFVQCTNTTPYSVALNGGVEGSTTARKMRSGTNKISYELYRDAARTLVWDNTTAGDVDGTGSGSPQPVTVYGRVPQQATPPAGNYSDTILVTVTY